jgi:sugar/nucleoside kinase (ribokinase family)
LKLDVVTIGIPYADFLFTGLPSMPVLGQEIFASGLGICPGAIANVCVAAARLGLRAGLIGAISHDPLGEMIYTYLAREGVDLSRVVRPADFATPITVSLSYPHDRAMVTYERDVQVELPRGDDDYWSGARAFYFHIGRFPRATLEQLHARGVRLFMDAYWDDSGCWDECGLEVLPLLSAFMPNEPEALALSRTARVEDALRCFAERTNTVVIKHGARGALAQRAGQVVEVPALRVEALDTTGAGDVFGAGFMYGALHDLSLEKCVRLANLVAGISVTQRGGSNGAPTWEDARRFVAALPEEERRAWEEIIAG